MSFVTELVCDRCGATYAPDQTVLLCRQCSGLLDAHYDLEALRRAVDLEVILRRKPNVWRWREFLPVRDARYEIDIGAGGSPLIFCPRLTEWIGARRVYAKYEGSQPTGSLKDRSFAVAVSRAAELGVRGAITYSSGNAAAALAAHAGHIGLRGLILVNAWADPAKLAMVRAFGMPLVKLDWTRFEDVEALMVHAIHDLGLYAFVNFQNPWRHEAYQTYAFENWLDLGRQVPDHEVHPIGTGGGIFGAWKGHRALMAVGWTSHTPRLHGTQPSACASLVTAFQAGHREATAEGDAQATFAEAIATTLPFDAGRRPLRAMYETGGRAVAVSDDEMRDGIRRLGQEGLFAEPAGASTVWAARRLAEAGVIKPDETVVLTVTATGLKQSLALGAADFDQLPVIPATNEALDRIVAGWER